MKKLLLIFEYVCNLRLFLVLNYSTGLYESEPYLKIWTLPKDLDCNLEVTAYVETYGNKEVVLFSARNLFQ